jgi:RHS repeat-associated protein
MRWARSLACFGAFLAGPAWATFANQTPPDETRAAQLCTDENVSPWEGGTDMATPGLWVRSGGGAGSWDLVWSNDHTQLKVFLYTYTELGRPIWLASRMTAVSGETWSGKLYKYTAPGTEGPATGSVAIRFFPNDPTRVAVNWDWDNLRTVRPTAVSECLASFIHIPPAPGTSSGGPALNVAGTPIYTTIGANQIFSGYWNTAGAGSPDAVPGLSLNILQPPTPADGLPGHFVDFNVLLTFDSAQQPVWLISDMNAPACTSALHCPAVPFTGRQGRLYYFQPNSARYPGGIPLEPCPATPTNPANCVTKQDVGSIQRNITSNAGTEGNITVPSLTNPANQFNASAAAQQLVSSNFFPPVGVQKNLSKITDSTGIEPVQYSCKTTTVDGTCNIWVPWHSSSGKPTPWRRNLRDSTYSRLAIIPTSAPVSNGEVVDVLRANDRVVYELWSGPGLDDSTPSGILVDQSAEVRAYGPDPGNGDSTSGNPAAAPAPFPYSPNFDANMAGAVAGEFRVDESGSATYRIPLVVAAGAGGFAPSLALIYNSSAGMGYFGTGVTLEGTSAILPCRPGVEFGDTDALTAVASAFCLDGQRLLLQSGTHRAAGAVYRTEIESFQKVVLESVSNLSVPGETSPLSAYTFAVYGKDGSVRRYGGAAGTVASKCFGCAGASPPPVAVSWLQTSLADASGNTLTYNYSPINALGERYLQSITYSGGQVTFNSTITGGSDVSYAVLSSSGFGRGRSQRSRIVGSIDVRSAEGVLRSYRLTYSNPLGVSGSGTIRPRLSSIKECSDSNATVCYAPTTFDWSDQAQDTTGNPDIQGSSNATASEKFPDLRSHKLGDFDGDHRSDLLWIDKNHRLRVSYSRPTASGLHFSAPVEVVTLGNFDFSALWEVIDFNGDGLDDVLYAENGTSAWEWKYRPGLPGGGFGPPEVIISGLSVGGPGTTDPASGGGGVVSKDEIGAAPAPASSTMADFDGDGRPDLLYALPGGSYRIALLKPDENGRPFAFASPLGVSFRRPDTGAECDLTNTRPNKHDAEQSGAVDLDGDGRADLHVVLRDYHGCAGDNPQLPILQNADDVPGANQPNGDNDGFVLKGFRSLGVQGNKFQFERYEWLGANLPEFRNVRIESVAARAKVLDINGDGLADLLFRTDGNHIWRYVLAGGTTVASDAIIGGGCSTVEAGSGAQAGLDLVVQHADLDGDGKLDFWCPGVQSGSNIPYTIFLWNGAGYVPTGLQSQYSSTSGPEWMRLSADYDGDGILDYLIIKATDGEGDADGGWHANRTTSHHQSRGMVTKITNGFGAETHITYSPLTFSSVYRRDYIGAFAAWGRGSAIFDMAAPNYVAHYVMSSSPSSANPGDMAIVRYAYSGLKVQAGGRGSLGFRRVGAYDYQTGMYVDTTYSQVFPLTGTPTRTTTYYLPNFAPDYCLANEGSSPPNSEHPQCLVRTPVCAAGLSTTCNDDIPSGTQSLKVVMDTWRYRVQPSTLQEGSLVPLGSPPLNAATSSTAVRPNIFIARVGSTAFDYDLETSGATLRTESTSFDTGRFDDFGNAQKSTMVNTGGGITLTTTSEFTYFNSAANWKLGRLLTAKAFNERSTGAKNGRLSTFTYDDPGNPGDTRKLLQSEKVEGLTGSTFAALQLDPAAKTVVTYHRYDGFGNKTATYTCSTGIPENTCRGISGGGTFYVFHPISNGQGITRYARNGDYDSLGRYSNKTYEGFSSGGDTSMEIAASTVVQRDPGGNPTELLDANSVTTKIKYDAMGRKRYEWNSTGKWAKYDYVACTTALCPSNRALAYYERTEAGGAPVSKVFYDRLGREAVRLTQGFLSSDFITVLTEYDDGGNVLRKSQPFLASNSTAGAATPASGSVIYWTTTTYDPLDRPTRIVNPDGGVVEIDYDKLATKTTLPSNKSGLRQATTQEKDGAGNVISTTDAYGLLVRYNYDGYGALLSVERNGRFSTATYDSLGRKMTTQDPNTGVWTYEVDGLGQVIKQFSPRGTCTESRYDARGRLWQRQDYDNASCTGTVDTKSEWAFDTASYGYGKLDKESASVNGTQKVQRTYLYNGYGQPIVVNTDLDGKTYVDQTNYDQFGRTFQTLFTAPGLPTTGELYEYNAYGYQARIRSAYPASNSMVYYEALAMDAYGHVTSEYRSSRVQMPTERTYDLRTGRLTRIESSGGYTQDLSYGYDAVGNMAWRHDRTGSMNYGGGRNLREEFSYDALQRLTGSTMTTGVSSPVPPSLTVQYDGEGNILKKYVNGSVVNSYTYGEAPATGCSSTAGAVQPSPYAVTSTSLARYCYDANGNVLRGGEAGTEFKYTPYDLPSELKSASRGQKTGYEYGPNREKIRRLNYPNATVTSTPDVLHYVGAAEVHWISGSVARVEVRRYVGPVLVVQTANVYGEQNYRIERQYFLTDAQGSTSAVLSDWGQPLNDSASMSFDPFGARRDPTGGGTPPWWAGVLQELDASTRHGYTGHEQVDAFGVIHMGGRLYDPGLGRFLQADPMVQDPLNSQSLNRYSYVLNNPMTYTDPTGYFSVGDGLRLVATAVIVWYAPYLASYLGGGFGGAVAAGAISGFAAGAVQTGNLKGAVNGAVSGAVFGGIGATLPTEGSGMLYESGRLSTSGYAVRALTSGVAGGVLSTMQGGRFGAGFASAGLGSALTPVAGRVTSNSVGQGFLVAIVGGTASAAGGGKFANGAVTAAFGFAFGSIAARNESGQRDPWSYGDAELQSFVDNSPAVVDTEVIFWDPVGSGRSSLGHVSVRIDDTSYSFAQGGMDIRSFEEYRGMNTFRNGHGYVLDLSPAQESAVTNVLSSYGKQYNYLPNNCTTPIQDALLSATGWGATPSGYRSQYYLPSTLDRAIRSSFDTSNVHYYQKKEGQ